MHQPDWLKTDTWVPWSNGPGNDVWAALTAAWTGDLPTLQRLIAANPDLRTCDEGYREPITMALHAAHPDVVAWLLEARPDPDSAAFGILPKTPQRAAYDPDYARAEQLVRDHLRSLYGVCEQGDVVAEAIRARDTGRVAAMIREDAGLVAVADQRGHTPLHWACLTRNLAMIDLLLEQGAAIDVRRPDGARPIEVAYGDYHYRTWYRDRNGALAAWQAVVGYLLARGAEYDLVVAAHLGDLDRAKSLLRDDPSLANALPQHFGYYTGFPLRVAAATGDLPMVELLLEHGADPNRIEPHFAPWGWSLGAAAGKGHRAVCERLVAAGANLNQEMESSGNVATIAGHGKHFELQSWLLEQGAKWPYWHLCGQQMVDELAARLAEDPEGAGDVRNFVEAARTGNRELWTQFLPYKPDAWEVCEPFCGPTPEATADLFAAGLDPSRANWFGITEPHQLAAKGDLPMLSVFLDHGADLDAIDDEYRSTLLGYAARTGQFDAASLLLDRGADPNGAGAEWARPLVWAETLGHDGVANLLRQQGAREA